jgi:hypothetical protein
MSCCLLDRDGRNTDKEKLDINWQCLSTELEEIGELHARRRAVDSLRAMKPTYLGNLDKMVFPSLKDVISGMQDQARQMAPAARIGTSDNEILAFFKNREVVLMFGNILKR